MNRLLLLFMLPLLSFGFISCDDGDDVETIDLKLLDGHWEVVDQGDQNVLERGCILDMTVSPDFINGSYGGYQGYITTYHLTVSGTPVHDRDFNWYIRYMENHQPLLDLVLQGELDSDDDIWDGNYYYKITKLTDTHMWWRANTTGDNSTVKFRRRTDITID